MLTGVADLVWGLTDGGAVPIWWVGQHLVGLLGVDRDAVEKLKAHEDVKKQLQAGMVSAVHISAVG